MSELKSTDLIDMAVKSKEHKGLLTGLAILDKTMNSFIREYIMNEIPNSDIYFLKTCMEDQCYNIYIYNQETSTTSCYTMPYVSFLEMCSTGTYNYIIPDKVKELIKKTHVVSEETIYIY